MAPSRRSLAALIVVALGLTGCATVAAEAPIPTAPIPTALVTSAGAPESPSPEPDPSPEPTSEPTPAMMPATCEELLPVATVSESFDEVWHLAQGPADPRETLPEPTARASAAEAEEELSCLWHPDLATEGFVVGYAFRLLPAALADLRAELAAAETYDETEIAGAEAYVTTESTGYLVYTTLYAFVDDVWVVFHGPISELAHEFAEDAVARIAAPRTA